MDVNEARKQLQIAEDAINKAQAALDEVPPEPPSGIVIKPGDDIQSIIDSSQPGDVLKFTPGVEYITGQLYLGGKSITLTVDGELPNRRISPFDSLPILKSGGPFCTIDGTNAQGLNIIGLHFEARDNGEGDVIILEGASDVIMDRIRIHGSDANGCKRGVRGNGSGITLSRSHLDNIWKFQQDSQCFCAWNGAGPFNIIDNFLEAASENILFGGADNASEAMIPSNILIENNDFTKRDAWRNTPNYYSVKNLFELKMAKHVVVKNNRFSKNWTDAQAGWAIVLKSANQDGGNPWAQTSDVIFEDNQLSETEHGINILGWDGVAKQTTDLVFLHNTFNMSGTGIQIGAHAGNIHIERNTFENGGTFMSLYNDNDPNGLAADKLIVIGTVGNHNEYGVKGGGMASGNPSLDHYIGQLSWADNVLNGYLNVTSNYPPTTYNSMADVPAGIEVGA